MLPMLNVPLIHGKGLRERLEGALEAVRAVKSLCRVPSISIGILHEGEVVFTGGVGERDVSSHELVNEETMCTLCSISKTFVSAAIGILVDEGKLQWTDPVGQYLPGFKPLGDSRVAEEATFNDFLRHSSGLANPVVTILGPSGKVIVPQKDFISVANQTPTDYEGKQRFNQSWMYSNLGYGLMTLVIERVTGASFAQFVQDRILNPLGMTFTAVGESQVTSMENKAAPYAHISDGTWHKLDHEWTSDKNSPVLGMVGIRSSVKDMLRWSAAVIDAFERAKAGDSGKPMKALSDMKENPLKEMDSILDDYWWGRPHYDPFQNESRYHLGWMKVIMPSCMVSWGSWNKTLADNISVEDHSFRDANILGTQSEKRLMFKSTGCGFCGVGSVNIFPETHTAIVVLSNGINCGDAADFVASLHIQEVFDLQPRVDILSVAKAEVTTRLKDFDEIMKDLQEHRGDPPASELDHAEIIGEYHGFGISIIVRDEADTDGRLELCFNGREDLVEQLHYYNVDQYTYWPESRDEWLKGGWLDWDFYMVGILTFTRDESGVVNGFTWVWEDGAEPYLFKKTSD